MASPKCSNCKCSMKKISNVNRIFMDKYVISDAHIYVCAKCGEEYLDMKEYGRIMKKITEIESKMQIPAVHEVMAKTKFFVL